MDAPQGIYPDYHRVPIVVPWRQCECLALLHVAKENCESNLPHFCLPALVCGWIGKPRTIISCFNINPKFLWKFLFSLDHMI